MDEMEMIALNGELTVTKPKEIDSTSKSKQDTDQDDDTDTLDLIRFDWESPGFFNEKS